MEDVASSMMKQFAERLEREITQGSSADPAQAAGAVKDDASGGPGAKPSSAAPARPGGGAAAGADDVLDVGGVLAGTQLARYAGIAGIATLVIAVIVVLLKGRGASRGFTVNLNR